MRFWVKAVAIIAMCGAGAHVLAKGKDKAVAVERPALFSKLIECRSIKEPAARLACYDQQVAAMDDAERKSELVVVDKQEVKKARRGLFGLSLPNLGGLFGKSGDAEDVDAIESTIKSVSTNANGKWVIVIADDARWVQIDTTSIRTPKVGQSIRIKKAALGSFFANINEQHAIRMKREN